MPFCPTHPAAIGSHPGLARPARIGSDRIGSPPTFVGIRVWPVDRGACSRPGRLVPYG